MTTLRTRSPWISVLVGGILLGLVSLLFGLQFRWVDQLDLARRRETERVLRAACDQIASAVDERLAALARGLAGGTDAPDPSRLEPELAALVAAIEPVATPLPADGDRILPGPALHVVSAQPDDGALAALLDRDYLTRALLPELARRALGEGALETYDLALLSADGSEPALYVASARFELRDADVRTPVLRSPNQWVGFFHAQDGEPAASGWTALALPPGADDPPARWMLCLRHRAGSIEAALARTKRWNLVAGGAVLAALVLALILVWIAEKRARRLMERELAFVAGVSHELRTPLAVARTAASNLATGVVRGDEKVSQYGAMIEREVERVGEMVERVLRLATGEGVPAPAAVVVDVRALIEQALEACRPWRDRRPFVIEAQVPEDLPTLRGDPQALVSALRNLLENAIKYGPEGQRIAVRAYVADREGDARAGRELVIEVRDEGPGIPAADRERAFDAFWRGQEARRAAIPGSGLGLAVVARVVAQHGGRVHVEAADEERDVGVRVVLRLPLAGPSAGPGAGARRGAR